MLCSICPYPQVNLCLFQMHRKQLHKHLHLVDIPFPKKVRDEIVNTGLAEPHHILPETGWVSFYLHEESDVQKVIALLHRSYEIAMRQKQRD